VSKETGGWAFPGEIEQATRSNIKSPGMTLRDYFAGQAIAGFASAQDKNGVWRAVDCEEGIAIQCYKIADAMIKERNND